MAHLIVAYPNRADEATLSGGDWPSLTLANLQTRLLSTVARSADLDLASTQFDVDLGRDRRVRLLVLVNHNITLEDSLIRIRGSDAADMSDPSYDSGWIDVWPVVYEIDQVEWEDDNWWSLKYLPEEVEGFTHSFVHILPDTVAARYWRIEIDDASNDAGYVQIGRLFIAGQWEPSKNFKFGASLEWVTDSRVTTSRGGVDYVDRRAPYRLFRFAIDLLDYDEAQQRALELMRRAGIDAEVFVVPDPDDSLNMIRRAFLGRMRELQPLTHTHYRRASVSFAVKELL